MGAVIRTSLIALLVFAVALPAREARAGEEGLQLGAAHEVRVSGTVVDARTGRPLPNAQVAIETAYETRRGDTGPDGSYLVTASAADGLGNVSVVFSHPDYQQKYFETVLRDALRDRLEVTVSGGHARMKLKKVNVDLACGQRADVETKGEAAAVTAVCDGDLTGAELEVRGNRIAVLASGPFVVRFEDGRLEVRNSQNATLDVRIAATMQPR
jgi:hypothetical protein